MAENFEVLKNFIVLEGLDGSGTTTQLNMLGKRLSGLGKKIFTTCEPSPLPSGMLIRRILEKEVSVEPETLARLFSADRYEHLYNKEDGVIKHLNDRELVISDRYLFSSLAYQSLGCGFELVKELNPYPLPEFLIYVDLTPEICRQRMSTREQEELFEGDTMQMKIIDNYERGMASYHDSGMKFIRIDGTKTPDEICSEIMAGISR